MIRRLLIATGAVVLAVGLIGSIVGADTHPVGQFTFLAAVLLLHDGLLLPLAIGAGVLVGRRLPAHVRGVVYAAGFASIVVTLVALPFVTGAGRRADDPSALPLDYVRGLGIVLVAIWLVAAGAVAGRIRHHRRVGHRPPDGVDRR